MNFAHMKALAELQGNSASDKRARDDHHATFEQRLKFLEQSVRGWWTRVKSTEHELIEWEWQGSGILA